MNYRSDDIWGARYGTKFHLLGDSYTRDGRAKCGFSLSNGRAPLPWVTGRVADAEACKSCLRHREAGAS